jgi:AcrR family transcriptional regulator
MHGKKPTGPGALRSEAKARRAGGVEFSEATRKQLIACARLRFATDGYDATSLETIASDCGLTKGALYHHFSGKADLFEAVFEEEQRRLNSAIDGAYQRERTTVGVVRAAVRGFLEASADRGYQRISLLDGPSVLGWHRMREIEGRHCVALIRKSIDEAVEAGEISVEAPDALTHLLFGALCEGALMLARADDQRAARSSLARELEALIGSLAAPPEAGSFGST